MNVMMPAYGLDVLHSAEILKTRCACWQPGCVAGIVANRKSAAAITRMRRFDCGGLNRILDTRAAEIGGDIKTANSD